MVVVHKGKAYWKVDIQQNIQHEEKAEKPSVKPVSVHDTQTMMVRLSAFSPRESPEEVSGLQRQQGSLMLSLNLRLLTSGLRAFLRPIVGII